MRQFTPLKHEFTPQNIGYSGNVCNCIFYDYLIFPFRLGSFYILNLKNTSYKWMEKLKNRFKSTCMTIALVQYDKTLWHMHVMFSDWYFADMPTSSYYVVLDFL